MKTQQDQFREYIIQYFENVKTRNSLFSLRALAKRAKLNPAALSEFLNGKRKFSSQMILRIAADIGFTPEEILILRDMGEAEDRTDNNKENLKQKIKMSLDHYYLVADWHHYAILCLAETTGFKNDQEWIAKRLDTDIQQVKVVLEKLTELGYFENRDGTLHLKKVILENFDDIPNTSLKKRHEENLEAAKEAVYTCTLAERDYSFTTIAINPEQLPRAKKMIREFRAKLLRTLEAGEKKEVYEVCFHLFPRSRSED